MDGETVAVDRDRLPPIHTPTPPGRHTDHQARGVKQPGPSLGSFISTLRTHPGGPRSAVAMATGLELPPICSDVSRDFQEDMELALQTGDWRQVREFYLTTFSSFVEVNAAFKREANGAFDTIDDSGVNTEFINTVYDALQNTPPDIQKSVLKGIINSLLREWKGPRTKDDLRAYFILLQFSVCSTVPARRFSQLVQRLLHLISSRLVPSEGDELPPPAKTSWWIPSATKILNAANSVSFPAILSFTDFYSVTLEHVDIMEQYRTWQRHGNSNKFSFCQYPFILSSVVKKEIIQRDSELQMLREARRVDMNILFLNIKVRRSQLLHDSLEEVCLHTRRTRTAIEFQLVGTLMGLAVYNSIALDVHFPLYCYRKLLTPPTAPCDQNAPVGMATATLEDLQQIMPELAHGLEELLNYEGNVEEDFYLTFQILQEEMGVVRSYNLKPGGDKIPVNNHNRKEYVQLYIDYLLNRCVSRQFSAFYHGFHSVCASHALMLLRCEEVEMLVCGSPDLDMNALQKAAQYEGYTKTDPTVRCFWEVVMGLPLEMQKKLLHFTTGSDRVPVGGLANLHFKISKIDVSTDW
ncbi:hypothetical protein NHX12_022614 [Muraenolepis orangiensis]|uniref:HECT-type E3 ubiquitin transferase n=1 Tax=Muraenolepis orangiensis TaxID=630683 RepID=A0A9Q0EN43_9TELE|nr:hypothetical protein NHX12_022614 [Muraenolepis orangiensis]